jgi:hypothetical protein
MDEQPRVVNAAVSDGGARINFDDGKSGLFPAALLYAILPQANRLQAADAEEPFRPQAD